jgi:hypothetical protein
MKKWESKFLSFSNDTDTMGTNKDMVIMTLIAAATRVKVAPMDTIDNMAIIVTNTALTCTNENSVVAIHGSVKTVTISLEIASGNSF